MTALPAKSTFDGTATPTTSTFKMAMGNLRDYLSGLLGAEGTGINEARGSVAMHATTMDLWAQPNLIDGTGGAVTITDIADAPRAGARRVLYPIAGSIITNGATFAVDGAANHTAAAGDKWEFEAITVSTFKVHVTKKDGTAVVAATAATQSDQETATSTTTFVSPGRQHLNPSAAKAWTRINISGGTPSSVAAYNVASITDNGVGDYSANYTTAFSSANYAATISRVGGGAGAQGKLISVFDQTAALLRVITTYVDAAGVEVAEDATTVYIAALGDQS